MHGGEEQALVARCHAVGCQVEAWAGWQCGSEHADDKDLLKVLEARQVALRMVWTITHHKYFVLL